MRRVQRSRDDAPLFVSFTVLPAYCSVVYTLLNFCEIARLREEERERGRGEEKCVLRTRTLTLCNEASDALGARKTDVKRIMREL